MHGPMNVKLFSDFVPGRWTFKILNYSMRSNFHKATKERADQLGHISSKKLVCDSFERPLEIEIDFYLHSTCRI